MTTRVQLEHQLTGRSRSDVCYMDYAAAPPYPTSLIHALSAQLTAHLFSNPHSHSPSAIATADAITLARRTALGRLFGVRPEDGWDVIFTSGTTAALKLVGESFDWRDGGFACPAEAHTSLIGIRDLAEATDRRSTVVETVDLLEQTATKRKISLIGIPAQDNATGQRFVDCVRQLCSARASFLEASCILVDAAAYLSASQAFPLASFDYETAPDFLACSLYKVLGHPTGIGCLVVKRSSWHRLSRKRYHGGGTLDAYTPLDHWKQPRKDRVAAFEDGTGNTHAIVGLPRAFGVYDEVFGADLERRAAWVREVSRDLLGWVGALRHSNGHPVIRAYARSKDSQSWLRGDRAAHAGDQGPTLCFNVLTPTGQVIPPSEVDRLACIQNIHLRAGRHCNAGVIVQQVGTTEEIIKAQWAAGMGCDEATSGETSASLRISIGLATTRADIDRLVHFLECFFCHRESLRATVPGQAAYELAKVIVYPIKSCAGQEITSDWPLTPHGLLHDREWAVVRLDTGRIVSQKRYPRMALIRPRVDRSSGALTVQVGPEEFFVATSEPADGESGVDAVCGQSVEPTLCTDLRIRDILTGWLGIPCTLARQSAANRHSKLIGTDRTPLLLSNESPFLLINQDSVDKVSEWLPDANHPDSSQCQAAVFRSNLIIRRTSGSSEPFAEDLPSQMTIGPHTFIAIGRCRRCQMVCIDPDNGTVKNGTYLALAKHRRNDRGRIEFGQHLMWREGTGSGVVSAGMVVHW